MLSMNLKLVEPNKNIIVLKSTNKSKKQLSSKQKNYVKNLATKIGFDYIKQMKAQDIKIKQRKK